MPRPDRGVAQRYASKKRKKRVAPGRASAAVASAERAITVDAVEAEDLEEVDEAPPPPPTRAPVRTRPSIRITTGLAAGETRRAAPRRTFESYAEEYSYVGRDLRRVAVVAGGLLLVLVILSFFLG